MTVENVTKPGGSVVMSSNGLSNLSGLVVRNVRGFAALSFEDQGLTLRHRCDHQFTFWLGASRGGQRWSQRYTFCGC